MRRLRRAVWRFWRMSQAERQLFLAAYARIIRIDLALRRHGFEGVAQRVVRAADGRTSAPIPDPMARARSYARWLEAAARYHVVRARCLHQSLALHQWLCEDGLPSELRIGVLKDGSNLRAHAWVMLGSEVVNDYSSAVAPFIPLLSVSAQASTLSESADCIGPSSSWSAGVRAMQW